MIAALRHGRIWLVQEKGSRRRGLWRLPEIPAEEAGDLPEMLRLEYAITRYRVSLRVHEPPGNWLPIPTGASGAWHDLSAPDSWPPLGSPYKKALLKIAEMAGET